MANYYVDENGNITKKKKKDKEPSYSVDLSGKVTKLEKEIDSKPVTKSKTSANNDDIAPVKKSSDAFESYRHYMTATDFSEKSQYKSTKLSKDASWWDKFTAFEYKGKKYGDTTYEYINNVDDIRAEIKHKKSVMGADTGNYTTSQEKKGYDFLTAEEIAVYNYIYASEGKKKAEEFLDSIETSLTKREHDKSVENIQKSVDGNPVAAAGLSVATILAKPYATVQSIGQKISDVILGNEYNPYAYGRQGANLIADTRKEVGDNITEATKGAELLGQNIPRFLYDTGMSVGDSAVGAATFGEAYKFLAGADAATQQARELYEQGATEEQITRGAIASGVFETLFESFSIDNLLKPKNAYSFKQVVKETLKQSGIEASEEMATEISNTTFDYFNRGKNSDGYKTYKGYLDNGYSEEEAKKKTFADIAIQVAWAGAGGALSGGVMGGVTTATGINNTMTKTEQTVADKVIETRISEQEKNGTKLTKKQKAEIEQQVYGDMSKGYISIDTIEETLGGDDYKAFKDSLNSEDAIVKEYDELINTKESEFTVGQRERLTELKEQIADAKNRTKSNELKSTLKDNVFNLVKDSRLAESYKEIERRKQAFDADLTQYNGKQREAVERAVKSGVLNNTNRSHELVNILSKIEADKGIVFDYADNAKLKETGFALDGKTVNGFVKDGAVTLNVQSAKSWQSVVGHEVTHVLEGTEAYSELQKSLFAYAESKGELASRKSALTELYKNVDADIDAELTADLVGDYLFSDNDFIKHLTSNRTVFEKVYDEIKYLFKVATGKEKADIEKVKRQFDKVWEEFTAEDIAENDNVKFSIREEAPPKETGIAYKVFYVKDGKLYPPMVANPDGADTPIGVWLNADVGVAAPPSKTGRAQVKAGGKGTQGGSGSLAFRPGWHLGDLPRASQFDRVNPETGKKELFPENFVWAEVEYAKDVDYQEEAMSYGYTDNGKFRHAYAGLPRLPENGYYRYRTNPKPDTVPWVITGAMKVNRLLSDAEVNSILEKNGVAPVHRQGGDVGLDKFGFEESGKVKYSVSADSEGVQLSKEQRDYFKDSKVVDDNGNLLVLYHGSPNGSTTIFDKSKTSKDNDMGQGIYFSTDKVDASDYLGKSRNNKLYTAYVNIKNPFVVSKNVKISLNEVVELLKLCDDRIIASDVYNDLKVNSKDGYVTTDQFANTNISIYMTDILEKSKKYDGIVDETVANKFGLKEGTKHIVALYSNQIKETTNTNPTADADIRYSLSKPDIDNSQNLEYNGERGENYVRTDEFRSLQAESQRMSDEDSQLYHSGERKIDSEVRGRLSRAFRLELRPTNSKRVYSVRTLLNPKTNNNVNIIEGVDGSLFRDIFEISRKYLKNGELVDLHEIETTNDGIGYNDCYNYLSEDGLSGFSITPDGDLISVFNLSAEKGFLKTIAPIVTEKAKTLDCYASPKQNLMTMYEKIFGFKTASVMDYNMDYDHDNIAENHSKPQVAFMINTDADVETRYFTETQYDEAKSYRDSFVNQETENIAPVKNSLSKQGEQSTNGTPLKDLYYGDDIAPVKETSESTTVEDAPILENIPVLPDEELADGTSEAIKPQPKRNVNQDAEPKLKRIDSGKPKQIGQVAKVLTEEPNADNKKQSVWSKFKSNFIDKGSAVEDLALKTKNRALQDKYKTIGRSEAKAQYFMENGSNGVKSLDDIRSEVEETGHLKEFYEYLYHKHNIDRMSLESREAPNLTRLTKEMQKLKLLDLKKNQLKAIASEKVDAEKYPKRAHLVETVREYLASNKVKNKPVFDYSVTAEMSQNAVKQFETAYPEFKAYAQDVYDNMKYLRKMMVDNGVISQETADLWETTYPYYVPIRRAGYDGASVDVPLYTNRTGVNAPIKSATGGNKDILPLFDTMAQRTLQTFKAIDKNRFGIELKNTLGSTVETAQSNLDEVIDSFDSDNAQDSLLQEGKNGKNPTFTVFENGERVTFEITDELYDALKPTSEGLAYTNKVLNTASSLHKKVLTEYNLFFTARNAIKDAQDVLINSQHPAKTYANFPQALKELVTGKGEYVNEYWENGGEQNTYFDKTTNTFTEEKSTFKKLVGLPLDGISKVNDIVEAIPRLSEYIASRKNGATVDAAMLDAARVTTDFSAGGDVTKFLNRNGATFLNASVQGAAQQVRNIREAKANGLKGVLKLASKYALAGLPALLFNSLMWDDDEEYDELSDYVKDNYYIVGKYGDGQFVRIPKGRTLSVIQELFEQIGNTVSGEESDWGNVFKMAISNVAPNNPIDNNVIAPIIQAATNKTWYGDDLVPTRLQDVPTKEQFDETIDSISKWLGEKTGISPYKINYVINQYSGFVGDMVLPPLTPKAERGDDSLLGNMIAPLKDQFTVNSTLKNQNITDFYSKADELKVNANSMYATDEDILKSKFMSAINSEMGDLYAEKREIQNSNLSDKLKYSRVEEIQKQINAMAKNGLNSYNDVYIDGNYATVGDKHYKLNDDSEWQKINDEQLEKQEKVTSVLDITPSQYWGNKEEYDYAYKYPEKYAVAKSVGGYDSYKTYSSELYDIKSDKDSNGKSINGSRKEKVINYINGLNADYETKIILFKSEYPSDDTYNAEIVNYLNSRDDLTYEERITIFTELGFTVKNDRVYWD